jgi:hypothetical protein
MAWPDTSLVAEVKLELNASLTADPTTYTFATDVTTLTFDRSGDSSIVIRRGRQDEQSVSPPSACILEVDNTDGRFVSRNPTGAYYPGLRRNTPIRVRVNPGTGLATRYVGFVTEWPPRWDVTEKDNSVPVRANGILRRLGQGATPLKSPLLRSIKAASSPPLVYLPLEDGSAATSFASGLTGGASATPQGGTLVSPGSVTATGSEPYVNFTADTNTTSGTLTSISLAGLGFSATKFSVSLVMTGTMPDPAVTTGWRLFEVATTGGTADAAGFQCYALAYCGTSGGVVGTTYGVDVWYESDGDDARAFTFGTINPFDGRQHSLLMTWTQVGADVTVSMTIDGVAGTSDTAVGVTLGTPTFVNFPHPVSLTLTDVGNNTGGRVGIGHFAMWGNVTPVDPYQASIGYAGEISGTRFARLCTEESVADDVTAGSTEAMGPQTAKTLLDLLRECEAAEEGLIVERLDGRLGFDPHADRENQAVALTLNYTARHLSPPLEPTDDDQLIRNDVTVTRTGGSKSQVVDTTGPVGVTAVGRYDEGVDLNLYDDTQPYNHAGWRVNLGTVDGLRFPTVTVNLRRNNSLTASFLALDIGSRIKITNLPDIISFDDVDLIVEGYTEQISQKNWVITFNCAPYRPYKVFKLANTTGDVDEYLGRLDWDSCVLAADITTTATSATVTCTPFLTVEADDYPLDIRVGGERMTVTAVVPVVSDSFSRSVSNSWGTPDVGSAWVLQDGSAANFSVNGSVGIMSHPTIANRSQRTDLGFPTQDVTIFFRIPVAPTGGSVTAITDLRCRWTDANNFYYVRTSVDASGNMAVTLNKTVGGAGSTLVTGATIAYNATHTYGMRLRANGSTIAAKVWDSTSGSEPDFTMTATDTSLSTGNQVDILTVPLNATNTLPYEFWFDNIRCMVLSQPQTLTVTRSVNGVVKAHLTGDAVTIDELVALAL